MIPDLPANITPLKGKAFRVVESQEQVATKSLVDNLSEQDLLEQLLETTKPTAPPQTSRLHYLLSTPFRYPPLKHGSRFGKKNEPSLFYGSQHITTALAETAYYRFLFWMGMADLPGKGYLTEHTLFQVSYATQQGLRLQDDHFEPYQQQLCSPDHYYFTQTLGQEMRRLAIEAFEFISARDSQRGVNIALFTPAALKSKSPLSQQTYLCQIEAGQVTFSSKMLATPLIFSLEGFLVEGTFPVAAD